MVTLECCHCKKSYEVPTRRMRAHRKLGRKLTFCSQGCLYKYQSAFYAEARSTKTPKERYPDGMAKCCKCGMLPIEAFGVKNGRTKLQNICRKCLYKAQGERWVNIKKKAIDLKGGKCTDCGIVDIHVIYDFHHKDPSTKEFDWTRLRIRSWDSIVSELEKCDLLCSNCHRKRHYKEQTDVTLHPR